MILKMIKPYMVFLVLVIALYSCSSEHKEVQEPSHRRSQTSITDSLLQVSDGVYSLGITVPKAVLTDFSKFGYRSNFGDVELFIHPKFHLYISDEDSSLESIKVELEEDVLFSRKFYEEAENELLYQSILPDGTETGFQWIKKLSLEGKSYLLKTESQGDFSKQQIRQIQECCKSIIAL